MLISYNWLQKYFEKKLPTPEKIAEGIIFHSFEVEDLKKLKDDTIFDIKILPDRAHDCLCHYGVAKEISVIFDIEIRPELELEFQKEIKVLENQKSNLKIDNQDDKCFRYMGRIIRNIKVKPSPQWLKNSLEPIGQKSINNIVDATNYVMFDIGNPIHIFDLDKLESSQIIIRRAKKEEKFTTLDKKEIVLDESILVIADSKDVLSIAGIKGGTKAEVDENTKNIVIEVANFDAVTIRKASKKLGIFTDSVKRFENGIAPVLTETAIEKITDLILELASGIKEKIIDVYQKKFEDKTISFSSEYINYSLGTNIKDDEIKEILNKFKYDFSYNSDIWKVKVPQLRLDITMACNMVEEIGRIYGYNRIKPQVPKIKIKSEDDLIWSQMNQARVKLAKAGYKEVMTYSFRSKGEIEVLASASNKKFLRTNLTDGLKESLKLNQINTPLLNIDEIKIFEIGTIFRETGEEIHVAYADKKNILETSLDKFISDEFSLPSSTQKEISSEKISQPQIFKSWSIYPFISRDIAVWVPKGINPQKLSSIYEELGTNLLITTPRLFDQFTKDKRTSYAFRLVFQSYDRTLTDDEINVIMSKIEEKIHSLGWTVR